MENKSSEEKKESPVVDISKFKHSAFFATSDGQGKLFKRTWMPQDYGSTKKATVLFLHGLADHCSRYSHVFEQLAKSGLQVESFDQRGFGYSGGVSTWTDLISDIEKEYTKIGSELPKFIYAVHAGAVAAIHFIAKHADKVTDKSSEYRVDGLVAAAPYLKPKVVKSAVRRSTMKLKGIVKPKTTTSIIKNFSLLSRDPETVKDYEQDKQATKRTSIIFLNEVLEKGEQAQKQAQQIKIPVLVIQGAQDEIADVAAVKLFFDHLASSDKQHEIIPELFHDIHHEPEKDKVIADILGWMLKYLPPPAEAKSPTEEKKKKKKEKKTKKEKKEKTASPEPRKEEATVEQNGKHEEKLIEPEKAEQTQKQESVEKKAESPTVKQPVPGKKTAVDFEFLGAIGRGAFGEVQRIKDIKSGQEYAVKMLNKKFIQESGKAGYVHTERNIFNKLNHPNVVKLSYTFQDPNTLFYVLELCPNGSLVSELQKVGRFSENSARFYIAELVSALEHMHSKGVIHRDLKPDNVLLGVGMHVKLTDFGTSKDIGTETRTRSDSFHGTEEFVSPELLDDESPYAAKASDLWALGCILYQLLVGKVPFKGETTYQTFQLIKKREFSYPSDISEEAKDLVDKLLVLDPEQRLGAGEGGYEKLKSHPFFNGIDFSSLHTTEPPKIVPPNAEDVPKQEEKKPKKEKKEKKSKKNQD